MNTEGRNELRKETLFIKKKNIKKTLFTKR